MPGLLVAGGCIAQGGEQMLGRPVRAGGGAGAGKAGGCSPSRGRGGRSEERERSRGEGQRLSGLRRGAGQRAAGPREGRAGLPGREASLVALGLLDLPRGHSCSALPPTLPSVVGPPARTTSPPGPEGGTEARSDMGGGAGPELTWTGWRPRWVREAGGSFSRFHESLWCQLLLFTYRMFYTAPVIPVGE